MKILGYLKRHKLAYGLILMGIIVLIFSFGVTLSRTTTPFIYDARSPADEEYSTDRREPHIIVDPETNTRYLAWIQDGRGNNGNLYRQVHVVKQDSYGTSFVLRSRGNYHHSNPFIALGSDNRLYLTFMIHWIRDGYICRRIQACWIDLITGDIHRLFITSANIDIQRYYPQCVVDLGADKLYLVWEQEVRREHEGDGEYLFSGGFVDKPAEDRDRTPGRTLYIASVNRDGTGLTIQRPPIPFLVHKPQILLDSSSGILYYVWYGSGTRTATDQIHVAEYNPRLARFRILYSSRGVPDKRNPKVAFDPLSYKLYLIWEEWDGSYPQRILMGWLDMDPYSIDCYRTLHTQPVSPFIDDCKTPQLVLDPVNEVLYGAWLEQVGDIYQVHAVSWKTDFSDYSDGPTTTGFDKQSFALALDYIGTNTLYFIWTELVDITAGPCTISFYQVKTAKISPDVLSYYIWSIEG